MTRGNFIRKCGISSRIIDSCDFLDFGATRSRLQHQVKFTIVKITFANLSGAKD